MILEKLIIEDVPLHVSEANEEVCECVAPSPYFDDMSGDTICMNCGVIIGERYIDTSATQMNEFVAGRSGKVFESHRRAPELKNGKNYYPPTLTPAGIRQLKSIHLQSLASKLEGTFWKEVTRDNKCFDIFDLVFDEISSYLQQQKYPALPIIIKQNSVQLLRKIQKTIEYNEKLFYDLAGALIWTEAKIYYPALGKSTVSTIIGNMQDFGTTVCLRDLGLRSDEKIVTQRILIPEIVNCAKEVTMVDDFYKLLDDGKIMYERLANYSINDAIQYLNNFLRSNTRKFSPEESRQYIAEIRQAFIEQRIQKLNNFLDFQCHSSESTRKDVYYWTDLDEMTRDQIKTIAAELIEAYSNYENRVNDEYVVPTIAQIAAHFVLDSELILDDMKKSSSHRKTLNEISRFFGILPLTVHLKNRLQERLKRYPERFFHSVFIIRANHPVIKRMTGFDETKNRKFKQGLYTIHNDPTNNSMIQIALKKNRKDQRTLNVYWENGQNQSIKCKVITALNDHFKDRPSVDIALNFIIAHAHQILHSPKKRAYNSAKRNLKDKKECTVNQQLIEKYVREWAAQSKEKPVDTLKFKTPNSMLFDQFRQALAFGLVHDHFTRKDLEHIGLKMGNQTVFRTILTHMGIVDISNGVYTLTETKPAKIELEFSSLFNIYGKPLPLYLDEFLDQTNPTDRIMRATVNNQTIQCYLSELGDIVGTFMNSNDIPDMEVIADLEDQYDPLVIKRVKTILQRMGILKIAKDVYSVNPDYTTAVALQRVMTAF